MADRFLRPSTTQLFKSIVHSTTRDYRGTPWQRQGSDESPESLPLINSNYPEWSYGDNS